MKILILTCNIGQGHNSTAKSIAEEFTARNVECIIQDALSFVSPKVSEFVSTMHTQLYRYAPGLSDNGYEFAQKHPSTLSDKSIPYNIFALGAKKLGAFIEETGCTGVICAHVFPALMITELKRTTDTDIVTGFIATDYTCSPGVAESKLDAYFIPHEDLTGEFIACGVPEEKLIPSGIPVKKAFFEKQAAQSAREALSLPKDCLHMLMMCGSMGCGPMEDITKELAAIMPENAHLSVVCGTNERLKKRIEKYDGNNIHVYGFADNVPLLMDSADLYITKPGGLSVTEAAYKRLPMAFIDAVSGCEGFNRYFFLTRSMALASNDQSKLPALIIKQLLNEKVLEKQRHNLAREFNMTPVKTICDFYCE